MSIRLGAALPERVATRTKRLLDAAPDPDAAMRFLERLRLEQPSAFDRICNSSAALEWAVSLFCYSRFLSEAVLKNPERLLEVASSGSFYRVHTVDEYEERLFEFLGAEYLGVPSAVDLARFRRRQLLRIVLRERAGGGHAFRCGRGAFEPCRRHPERDVRPNSGGVRGPPR